MIYVIPKLLVNLVLVILSPIFLLFLLPIYGFRYLVSKVVVLCDSKIDKILTTRSSCSGAEPIYKNPKCSLVTVVILEGTLGLEKVRQLFQSRILEPKYSNGKLKKPEVQEYITKRCGFLFWKWEERFDIKEHIRTYDYAGKLRDQLQNGTRPVNAEMLMEVCDELVYKPFKPSTSPWEVFVINNYRESDSGTGPVSTALVVRIHHCLGDGFTILKTLTLDLTEGKQELDSTVPKFVLPKFSFLRALRLFFSAPYEFLSEAKNAVDTNSWHVPEKQLKRSNNSAISPKLSIEWVKEVKLLNKASFTGVILECFTGALRKFMSEAGYSVPDSIHCVTPLPIPNHPDKMRNHLYLSTSRPLGTGLVRDPAYIVGRITLVWLGLVKSC